MPQGENEFWHKKVDRAKASIALCAKLASARLGCTTTSPSVGPPGPWDTLPCESSQSSVDEYTDHPHTRSRLFAKALHLAVLGLEPQQQSEDGSPRSIVLPRVRRHERRAIGDDVKKTESQKAAPPTKDGLKLKTKPPPLPNAPAGSKKSLGTSNVSSTKDVQVRKPPAASGNYEKKTGSQNIQPAKDRTQLNSNAVISKNIPKKDTAADTNAGSDKTVTLNKSAGVNRNATPKTKAAPVKNMVVNKNEGAKVTGGNKNPGADKVAGVSKSIGKDKAKNVASKPSNNVKENKNAAGSGTPRYAASTESSRAKQKTKVDKKIPSAIEAAKKQSAGNIKCKRGGSDSDASADTECAGDKVNDSRRSKGETGTKKTSNASSSTRKEDELADTATSGQVKRKKDKKTSSSDSDSGPEASKKTKKGDGTSAESDGNTDKPPHRKAYDPTRSPTLGGPVRMVKGTETQEDAQSPSKQGSHGYRSEGKDKETARKLSGPQSPRAYAEMNRQTANKLSIEMSTKGHPNYLAKSNRPHDLTSTKVDNQVAAGTSTISKGKDYEKKDSDEVKELDENTPKMAKEHGEASSHGPAKKAAGKDLIGPDSNSGETFSTNLDKEGRPWMNVPQPSCHNCQEVNKATGISDDGAASAGHDYSTTATRARIAKAYDAAQGSEEQKQTAAYKEQKKVFAEVIAHEQEYHESHPHKTRRDLRELTFDTSLQRLAIRRALVKRAVYQFLLEQRRSLTRRQEMYYVDSSQLYIRV